MESAQTRSFVCGTSKLLIKTKEATNIKVRDNITYAQLGCHEDYFEQHIKDKGLKVIDQVKDKFLIVEDAEGETFPISDEVMTISFKGSLQKQLQHLFSSDTTSCTHYDSCFIIYLHILSSFFIEHWNL